MMLKIYKFILGLSNQFIIGVRNEKNILRKMIFSLILGKIIELVVDICASFSYNYTLLIFGG